jgi:hypothetical protein
MADRHFEITKLNATVDADIKDKPYITLILTAGSETIRLRMKPRNGHNIIEALLPHTGQ